MHLTIKNWKLEDNWQLLDWIIKSKDWKYVIKERKNTRSDKQNSYYWALIDLVSKETGIDKDEIHEKMRYKFLTIPPKNEKQLPYCKSTSKLTTSEFWEYIEAMRNFFAELLGMNLPDANEWENFINND